MPYQIYRSAIFAGTSLLALLCRLSSNCRGVTAIEYAVIASAVAVTGVSVVAATGTELSGLFDSISTGLRDATGLSDGAGSPTSNATPTGSDSSSTSPSNSTGSTSSNKSYSYGY